MCKSPPETPYVTFMLKVLAQARSQNYVQSAPLQIVIWLAYRVLDINPRNAYAYTVLAYLFCLLGESERGLLILKHFQHMHKGMRLDSDHPVQVLQGALQGMLHPPQNATPTPFTMEPLELALPSLEESLQLLEHTPLKSFQANIQRGLPALNRLMIHISELSKEKE
jgi:hypothetical protein